ncbi:MAG: hypothetical protein ING75_16560 [Rhodocyclaceae bacterium]|nr:hypothetical protein [Rhodocyclaceae bacterium]
MGTVSAPSQAGRQPRDFGRKVKVYSGQAAATIEATVTREGEPTLSAELAKKLIGSDRYAWDEKITVQLTPNELIQFNRVLLGHAPAFACEYHGEQRNKSLRLLRLPSEDGWMLVANQPSRSIQVPLRGADLFNVSALALSRLSEQWPQIGVGGMVAILRQIPQQNS